jgi:flavin reductase (DIM6/NTAB) family NADH-FMN oxidoreductase RutF
VEGLLEELDGAGVIVDPARENPANVYKLLIGSVVPRPIAFVSSVSAEGIRNLAPFSFFTVASANPPIVCFCPMIRGSDGGRKDTLQNVEATGEFVVNIVSEDFAEQMNACSGEYAPDVDEFEVSGLTPVSSDLVRPPRVGESRVSMESRLVQVVHVSPKPLGGSIVLGEVVRFHIDESVFEDFRIDPNKLNAIGRMGGAAYARTTDRFDMARPGGVPVKR